VYGHKAMRQTNTRHKHWEVHRGPSQKAGPRPHLYHGPQHVRQDIKAPRVKHALKQGTAGPAKHTGAWQLATAEGILGHCRLLWLSVPVSTGCCGHQHLSAQAAVAVSTCQYRLQRQWVPVGTGRCVCPGPL